MNSTSASPNETVIRHQSYVVEFAEVHLRHAGGVKLLTYLITYSMFEFRAEI